MPPGVTIFASVLFNLWKLCNLDRIGKGSKSNCVLSVKLKYLNAILFLYFTTEV